MRTALEQARDTVAFDARNDGLGFSIPYEYDGVGHAYEPDYLVRLTNRQTLILEIKGYQTDLEHAKHTAAHRWVAAVNNWGDCGQWCFHVCHNPQLLAHELRALIASGGKTPSSTPLFDTHFRE